ncbi:MAG TPA: toll/interleukin-1 receptor domain-containing protein [Myxococcaceae bacterium]|nr:toll/interleukin-1 receptor domain-containing protein [Myxococcaceae bacterium]
MRDLVFVSYSHPDIAWLERLKIHLKPLERQGILAVWDDQRIRTGAQWQEEIRSALGRAKVAVLLVSPDFLASDFIAEQELPRLLDEPELTVVWVPVRTSNIAATKVGSYKAALDPKRSLAEMDEAEADRALVTVTEEIERAYRGKSPSSVSDGVRKLGARRRTLVIALAVMALAVAAAIGFRRSTKPEEAVTAPPAASAPPSATLHVEGDVVQNVGPGGNGVIGNQVNAGGKTTEGK